MRCLKIPRHLAREVLSGDALRRGRDQITAGDMTTREDLYVFLEFRAALVDQSVVPAVDLLVGLVLRLVDTPIDLFAVFFGFLLNVTEIWHRTEGTRTRTHQTASRWMTRLQIAHTLKCQLGPGHVSDGSIDCEQMGDVIAAVETTQNLPAYPTPSAAQDWSEIPFLMPFAVFKFLDFISSFLSEKPRQVFVGLVKEVDY